MRIIKLPIEQVLYELDQYSHNAGPSRFVLWAGSIRAALTAKDAEIERLRAAATRYLAHSDSGTYRDSAGLRPGSSPAGEDLRAALARKEDKPA